MATLYISEYASLLQAQNGSYIPVPQEPAIAVQTVAISGTSAQSAAFNAATKFIRVSPDGICSLKWGSNPTATTSDFRMVTNGAEYIGVTAGHKVAVITNT